jgi:amidohydrolase
MLDRAKAHGEEMVSLRRQIHRHPEPAFGEVRTAQLVADQLASLGIPHKAGVGGTGVVGELGQGGRCIALRADMDALPIQEENQVPYASEVPGMMHACGHDVHVAGLLGAARLLAEEQAAGRLPGRVRLLFQPAEESTDAQGRSGAMRLVEEGAMDGVDGVLGLHVAADQPLGTISLRDGTMTAFTDRIRVDVLGEAAHGACPQKGFDAVVLAAHVIQALQTVVSRRLDPTKGRVLTIGTIHGGDKENVVASKVTLAGTIRTFDPEMREAVYVEVRRACEVARAMGGDYDLKLNGGYPAVVNDKAMASLVRRVGAALLGADNVLEMELQMHGEDFSFLSQEAPGCYFNVGGAIPGEPERLHHNPRFDVDERCLPIGAAVMASAAIQFLQSPA